MAKQKTIPQLEAEKAENEDTLRLYHMAECKLKPYFKDGKLPL